MKKQILILSVLLFEAVVLVALFYKIHYAIVVFGLALVVYGTWLATGKIEPYRNSPYSHMPNWPIK